jgi:hypothetical protein
MKRYFVFLMAMLAIDWVLGALQTAHILPLWTFLVFNFPFGLPSVWLESHWTGTQYSLSEGQSISETWPLVAFFFAVAAQAWLYSILYARCRNRRFAVLA